MSEQPQPQEQQTKWGDNIIHERKAELYARLQAWEQETDRGKRMGMGPFDRDYWEGGLTGSDVCYLAAHALAGSEEGVAEAFERLQSAQGIERYSFDLSALHLERADLRGANVTGATLRGASLTGADLSGANVTGATFYGANLTGTNLYQDTLAGTSLRFATLTGANLCMTTLTGADLQSSRMDSATDLNYIVLNTHTKLGDVVWNGAPLARVDWSQAPTFGDEEAIAAAKTRKDRIKAIHDASRAYRGLTTALRSQSMSREASHYRLREQRLEQHAQRLERHYGGWLFSAILDLISGYGEEPGRIFAAYLVVVLSFAAAYFGITNFGGTVLTSGSHPLQWYEAIVLSLSSFHGRGFFPQTISLGDPVAVVAALEAVTGLFIELILIATFSKRFLAS